MSSKADRLLCCAVAYANAETVDAPIPTINSSSSVDDVIQSMMNVLWFEAKHNMNESMTDVPSDPYLHAVDMDTNEPGIVSSKGKLDIHRRKLPIPKVSYTHRQPVKLFNVFDNSVQDVSATEALQRAEKEIDDKTKKAQKYATREIKNERASLDKIEKRECEKKKRQQETPEEREERLIEMREKKAKKKAEKELQEALENTNKSETKNEAINRDDETTEKIAVEKSLSDNLESENVANVAVNIQELLEAEASADAIHHGLMPQRVKARNRKTKFHPSPVPFDRHLIALEATWPADHVQQALISCKHDERIKIIQGPPGTGKTTTLLTYVSKFPDQRIFICAATNVGAANMYTRLVMNGESCSLLMPPSRIPPGTPITSQDPHNRIVCSTISGRSGPILDSQSFDVILVDEAAQCMEAWFWGLIRPEVHNIVMVGDTAQLPALVSEKGQKLGHDRSLMQRMIESKYPYEILNVQRRMHPEIVTFPNKYFYDDKLSTSYNNADFELPPYLLHHVQGTCQEIGTSHFNELEAIYCIKQATKLAEYTKDVVILCPYQAQARHLLSLGSNIQVHTIDSFQGREADCVVLSIVRTNTLGFWSDKRRLCVALTRAKHALHIVGDCKEWTGILNVLYEDAKERNLVHQED
jgi:hypothetical protein